MIEDPAFEKRLREAYVGFGPMMVSSIARQEHKRVQELEEFISEWIEYAALMSYGGRFRELQVTALELMGLDEEAEQLREAIDGVAEET